MHIRLITVGKPDNPHYAKLSEMYTKRLTHYTRIRVDHIRQEKISQSSTGMLQREETRIREKIDNRDILVALDKSGSQLTSPDLAEWLNKQQINAVPGITFVIGGPLGLSSNLLTMANKVMSFSPMTFPHELAAVMLLEQVYRAYTILRGEKYHK